jgi:syntaxin-binding protein 1
MLQREMDDIVRNDANFIIGHSSAPATVIILDRSIDTAAPLLHEFTYQAMINDVLELDNSKYQYGLL